MSHEEINTTEEVICNYCGQEFIPEYLDYAQCWRCEHVTYVDVEDRKLGHLMNAEAIAAIAKEEAK